jgi:hypothetical protein
MEAVGAITEGEGGAKKEKKKKNIRWKFSRRWKDVASKSQMEEEWNQESYLGYSEKAARKQTTNSRSHIDFELEWGSRPKTSGRTILKH